MSDTPNRFEKSFNGPPPKVVPLVEGVTPTAMRAAAQRPAAPPPPPPPPTKK